MSATTDEDEPECPGCGGTLFVARSGSPAYPWRCHAGHWCGVGMFDGNGRVKPGGASE